VDQAFGKIVHVIGDGQGTNLMEGWWMGSLPLALWLIFVNVDNILEEAKLAELIIDEQFWERGIITAWFGEELAMLITFIPLSWRTMTNSWGEVPMEEKQ